MPGIDEQWWQSSEQDSHGACSPGAHSPTREEKQRREGAVEEQAKVPWDNVTCESGVVREGSPKNIDSRRICLFRVPEKRDSLTCLGNREDSVWLEGQVTEMSLKRWVRVRDWLEVVGFWTLAVNSWKPLEGCSAGPGQDEIGVWKSSLGLCEEWTGRGKHRCGETREEAAAELQTGEDGDRDSGGVTAMRIRRWDWQVSGMDGREGMRKRKVSRGNLQEISLSNCVDYRAISD